MVNTDLFDTAVMGAQPAHRLLVKTRARAAALDWEALTQIDGLLAGILVRAIRRSDHRQLTEFGDALSDFLDSDEAQTIDHHSQGHDLLRRWEMLFDLVYMVEENYDAGMVSQAIAARSKGKPLVNQLHQHAEGLRANALAEKLGISQQNLSKLLRYFEEKGLIERVRAPKMTLVRLSILGRVHMAETSRPQASPPKRPASHQRVAHLVKLSGGHPRNFLVPNYG